MYSWLFSWLFYWLFAGFGASVWAVYKGYPRIFSVSVFFVLGPLGWLIVFLLPPINDGIAAPVRIWWEPIVMVVAVIVTVASIANCDQIGNLGFVRNAEGKTLLLPEYVLAVNTD